MCIFGVWVDEYAMTYVEAKSATIVAASLSLATHVTPERSLGGFSHLKAQSPNGESLYCGKYKA